MATVSEKLSEEFSRWERRGRGFLSWGTPVRLEPPFQPFPGYGERTDDILDDGRRSTALSRLFGRISGRLAPIPSKNQGESSEEEKPPGFTRDRIVEVHAFPPADTSFSVDAYRKFFASLSSIRDPVAFEVQATGKSARIQFAVSPDDAPALLRQLVAHFPETNFVASPDSLETRCTGGSGSDAAVIEFGLGREFLIPFERTKLDPLVALFGALTGVEEGETALVQVLFEPTQKPWTTNIERLVAHADGKPVFRNAPELVSGAKVKTSVPLYSAVVRVAVIAKDFDRSSELVGEIAKTLAVLESPAGNSFVPVAVGGGERSESVEDLIYRQSRRSGMLLSAEELALLVHLPTAAVHSKCLLRQTKRTRRVPEICLREGLQVGKNIHLGEEKIVSLTHDQRSRHMHLIGASGTGKSTLLLNLINQDIENGEGVGVIDPHGDLIDAILSRIPKRRIGDVVLIDPSDEEYPVGLNVLEAHSDLEKNLLASDLVAVFRRLSTSWGDQLNSILANAILAFLESERGGTLLELRRFLVEPGFRAEFLKTVRDPEVVYYWQKEFPFLSGKPQGPVLTRLDIFLRPKAIRKMVSQRRALVDFAEIINGRKILLVKLSQGLVGEENAFLLGSLLVGRIHQTAIARQAMQESERPYFFLYADEFHHYVTPSMATILSGARKYRLGLTLAHQELRQIEGRDADVASAVLSNPYTRICFRVGDSDARKLAPGYSSFEAKDLMNLGVGEAICRVERADFDFNLSVPAPEPAGDGGESIASQVLESSRKRYAVRRREIEGSRVHESPSAPSVGKPVESNALPSASPPVVPIAPKGKTAPDELIEILPPKPPSSPGRGGAEHKRLQALVKSWSEGIGWRAELEAPAGAGGVDVLISKGETTVACELSVTTSATHEVANLQKCLAAGFTHVVSVSESERRAAQIEEAAAGLAAEAESGRLRFLTLDGLFRLMEELDAKSRGGVKTIRGIKVKVSYRTLPPEEARERQERLAEVVAGAMRRERSKGSR